MIDVYDNGKQIQSVSEISAVSDGYHTFDELYEFRKLYNAAFVKSVANNPNIVCEKSVRHSDGALCFGGEWFIVNILLPTGMISNHYRLADWDLFQCKIVELPHPFDGHTPKDVIDRLTTYLSK
jgi:hypothetical protein